MEDTIIIPGWVVAIPLVLILAVGFVYIFRFAATERARALGLVCILAAMGLYYLATLPFRYDPAAPETPPTFSPVAGDGVPA